MADCPVCGHKDGNCAPPTRHIITSTGERKVNGPTRVPKQRVRFGTAGYIGKVEIFDPKNPNIRLVNEAAEKVEVLQEPEQQTEETTVVEEEKTATTARERREGTAVVKPRKKTKAGEDNADG